MFKKKYLIFIDANILLDFYRLNGHRDDLSILKRLESHLDAFIVTGQVEMEFKKHRQAVILQSHAAFKPPDVPAFLMGTAALADSQEKVTKVARTIKTRMMQILQDPAQDGVYAAAQRLFTHDSTIRLRDDAQLSMIRRRAVRRFLMGFPPRKRDDTSVGDAINWEWIVHCAKERAHDVVIASRDSDYGPGVEGKPVINSWLAEEFTRRVASNSKVVLVGGLAAALKEAGLPVTEQEERTEKEFVQTQQARFPVVSPFAGFDTSQLAAMHSALESVVASQRDLRQLAKAREEINRSYATLAELLAQIKP